MKHKLKTYGERGCSARPIRGASSWAGGKRRIYVRCAGVSMLFALLFISNNQLQRLLHLHSFLQLKQRRSAERTSRALESYLFTLLPVFTSNTSTMLFRSLLLFAFTSLSVAVAVPPNMSDDSMRRAAAAACDNLCNRSGKIT